MIASLDPSKSTGPDGIAGRMLRATAVAITPSITKLFNLSLACATFPDDWKMARIVPVSKASNPSSPTNYRPVSILPVISKLLEHHVHKLVFQHLCVHYPISSRQWGFNFFQEDHHLLYCL